MGSGDCRKLKSENPDLAKSNYKGERAEDTAFPFCLSFTGQGKGTGIWKFCSKHRYFTPIIGFTLQPEKVKFLFLLSEYYGKRTWLNATPIALVAHTARPAASQYPRTPTQ